METNEKNIKQYKKIVKENKPKPKKSHLIMSFLVGGFICIIGQIINDFFSMKGFSMTEASNMTSIVLVFIGSFLTGIGVYDNIGKKAGAGSIVPITGFANSVEYSKEGYIFGMAANMFKIAGPVIVFGITSSSIVGLIYFILTR